MSAAVMRAPLSSVDSGSNSRASTPSPWTSESDWFVSGQQKSQAVRDSEKLKSWNWKADLFVWKKKLLQDGMGDLTEKELRKLQKRKVVENMDEIEAIKKRKIQRDDQMEKIREEREMIQREKEVAFYDKWHGEEEDFFLKQAKLRSRIRLEQGRAKLIDKISLFVEKATSTSDAEVTADEWKWMENPVAILASTTIKSEDVEDLIEDILTYKKIDGEGKDMIWDAIRTIARFSLRHQPQFLQGRAMDPLIESEISRIFTGKCEIQIEQLEAKVRRKLLNKDVDVSYWETLLSFVDNTKSCLLINNLFTILTTKRLSSARTNEMIIKKQRVALPLMPSRLESVPEEAGSTPHMTDAETDELEPGEDGETVDYSIPYLEEKEIRKAGVPIISPEEDKLKLLRAREQVLGVVRENEMKLAPVIDLPEATRDSLLGSVNVNRYLADMGFHPDQFRTKKPRFFNKVHTGFVWNRYNRTHYNRDDPPPKMVMGYKFTVFYPDLIDKSSVPRVSVSPCTPSPAADLAEPEMALLRISAGPPYEDVAFKIVGREWDKSWKSGYKCEFKNDKFQLWFRFKRVCYRR